MLYMYKLSHLIKFLSQHQVARVKKNNGFITKTLIAAITNWYVLLYTVHCC